MVFKTQKQIYRSSMMLFKSQYQIYSNNMMLFKTQWNISLVYVFMRVRR